MWVRPSAGSRGVDSITLMTANFPAADLVAPPGASADAAGARAGAAAGARAWTDRKVLTLLVVALLGIYGLLQNRYWVPSGDSEVYISIARNLARDGKYEFNGQPVAMVPPGWPVVMAAVMKVTPYFLPLKLLAMGCVIGFLVTGYRIARRFVSPERAAVAILVTSVLSVVYPATYWLISEGLFCFVSALALLLAMQVREGRQQWWRIGLLALLCGAAVSVRWAGVLGMFLVAAALLQGGFWPKDRRIWIALLLSTAVAGGTFFGLREVLRVTPAEAKAAEAFGGAGEDTGAQPIAVDKQIATEYKLVTGTANSASYPERLIGWGRWLAFFFWQPFRAAAASHALSLLCNALGWILLFLIMLAALLGALRGQWLWIAVLAYCGALAMNWPIPNARYLVPVSFLLTVGVLIGAEEIRSRAADPLWRSGFAAFLGGFAAMLLCVAACSGIAPPERRDQLEQYVLPAAFVLGAAVAFAVTYRTSIGRLPWAGVVQGCVVLFVGGTAACNLALYALEVSVERSRDFYASYEAGLNQSLIAAVKYLSDRGVQDGQVAVSSRYQNLGRTRSSPFGLRATTLLTGRAVEQVPWKLTGPPSTRLRSWLNHQQIEYYLYQPPVSPWRVGHLRLGWWEQKVTGVAPEQDRAGWRLYKVNDDKMPEVVPPPAPNWPTRVPGL